MAGTIRTVVSTLYDFSDKYIKQYSTEDLRLRILLNRAQTYKWLEQEDECLKIIKSEDWSAKGDLFKLASYVLQDDYTNAGKLMTDLGDNPKVIDKSFYRDWPVFNKFRKTDEFKEAYKQIYKTEFEITEEMNNSTQQSIGKSRADGNKLNISNSNLN